MVLTSSCSTLYHCKCASSFPLLHNPSLIPLHPVAACSFSYYSPTSFRSLVVAELAYSVDRSHLSHLIELIVYRVSRYMTSAVMCRTSRGSCNHFQLIALETPPRPFRTARNQVLLMISAWDPYQTRTYFSIRIQVIPTRTILG